MWKKFLWTLSKMSCVFLCYIVNFKVVKKVQLFFSSVSRLNIQNSCSFQQWHIKKHDQCTVHLAPMNNFFVETECQAACLRGCVCLCVWSVFTQPSGQSLKHLLQVEHSWSCQVSRWPGGQVAGVSLPRPFPCLNSGWQLSQLKQNVTLLLRFF